MISKAYDEGFIDGQEILISKLLIYGFDSKLLKTILNVSDADMIRLEEYVIYDLSNK